MYMQSTQARYACSTKYQLIILNMKNRMNYTKGIIFLISGILSLATTHLTENEFSGFLTGFGYTAVAGGTLGIVYTFFKNQKVKKQGAVQ